MNTGKPLEPLAILRMKSGNREMVYAEILQAYVEGHRLSMMFLADEMDAYLEGRLKTLPRVYTAEVMDGVYGPVTSPHLMEPLLDLVREKLRERLAQS